MTDQAIFPPAFGNTSLDILTSIKSHIYLQHRDFLSKVPLSILFHHQYAPPDPNL